MKLCRKQCARGDGQSEEIKTVGTRSPGCHRLELVPSNAKPKPREKLEEERRRKEQTCCDGRACPSGRSNRRHWDPSEIRPVREFGRVRRGNTRMHSHRASMNTERCAVRYTPLARDAVLCNECRKICINQFIPATKEHYLFEGEIGSKGGGAFAAKQSPGKQTTASRDSSGLTVALKTIVLKRSKTANILILKERGTNGDIRGRLGKGPGRAPCEHSVSYHERRAPPREGAGLRRFRARITSLGCLG